MSDAQTDYGMLIQQLSTESDLRKREQIAARLANRLEAAFTASTNTAQVVRWETEEWLRQRVGETNDLIGQLNQDQQGLKAELACGFDGLRSLLSDFRAAQEAAVKELRAEFQEVGESVSQIKIDVAAVSDDVAVIREEVMQHGKRLTHLEQGQRGITAQQNKQAGQIQELTRQLEEMRQELAGRPSNEEAAELVTMIRRHEQILNPSE